MLLQQGQLESTVTQKCNLLSVSMERCFFMGSTSTVMTTHHVKREQNLKLITADTASHRTEEAPDVKNSVNTISVRHITDWTLGYWCSATQRNDINSYYEDMAQLL